MKTMAIPLLLLLSTACSTQQLATTRSTPSDTPLDFPVIDAHTHTVFKDEGQFIKLPTATQEEYFREMSEAGITAAVAHTLPNGEGYVDLRSRHVIHCAGTGAKVDVRRIEQGLKSHKYGCIKIYLGYIAQYANDKQYESAYRLAEKYSVPVVFHTGDTYWERAHVKYADPLLIDDVAVAHPKVNFVIAHCGNPWIASAAEVAYKNSNVYLDGSALMVGDMDKLPPAQVEEYVVKPLKWVFGYVDNPKKLMFGTDWPLSRMRAYLVAFKRAIPREHWKAVFHDNAARIFKLP